MGLVYQIIGTAILCVLSVNMGLLVWWPVTTLAIFPSPSKTPLNRAMTEIEMTLLLSVAYIGAWVSTLSGGFLLKKIGRKKCAILLALSFILFWAALAVIKQVEVILIIVCFSGIAFSGTFVISIYVSEICQESIRGTMTAFSTIANGLGILLVYVFEGYLSYYTIIYIGLSTNTIGTVLLFLLKDSPVYLMQMDRETEAKQAIAFYRHMKTSDKQVTNEILILKSAINAELDGEKPENEKLNPDLKTTEKLSFWQFMKKSKSSRRAVLLNLVLFTISIFQGLSFLQTFAVPLFSEAIPSLSPTWCSVLMGLVNVSSGLVGAYLTDIIGRRNLMIYGSLCAGISCIVLGTQMQLHWGPNWTNAIFLYLFTMAYTVGAGTVPMILQAEIFLPEVRSILSMIVIEWSWSCYLLSLLICNPIVNAFGWSTLFYIFSVMCFLTIVISVFFLPETMGLNVEEMQPLLLNKKHRNCRLRGI